MCGIGFVLLISIDSCAIIFSERYISEALQDRTHIILREKAFKNSFYLL